MGMGMPRAPQAPGQRKSGGFAGLTESKKGDISLEVKDTSLTGLAKLRNKGKILSPVFEGLFKARSNAPSPDQQAQMLIKLAIKNLQAKGLKIDEKSLLNLPPQSLMALAANKIDAKLLTTLPVVDANTGTKLDPDALIRRLAGDHHPSPEAAQTVPTPAEIQAQAAINKLEKALEADGFTPLEAQLLLHEYYRTGGAMDNIAKLEAFAKEEFNKELKAVRTLDQFFAEEKALDHEVRRAVKEIIAQTQKNIEAIVAAGAAAQADMGKAATGSPVFAEEKATSLGFTEKERLLIEGYKKTMEDFVKSFKDEKGELKEEKKEIVKEAVAKVRGALGSDATRAEIAAMEEKARAGSKRPRMEDVEALIKPLAERYAHDIASSLAPSAPKEGVRKEVATELDRVREEGVRKLAPALAADGHKLAREAGGLVVMRAHGAGAGALRHAGRMREIIAARELLKKVMEKEGAPKEEIDASLKAMKGKEIIEKARSLEEVKALPGRTLEEKIAAEMKRTGASEMKIELATAAVKSSSDVREEIKKDIPKASEAIASSTTPTPPHASVSPAPSASPTPVPTAPAPTAPTSPAPSAEAAPTPHPTPSSPAPTPRTPPTPSAPSVGNRFPPSGGFGSTHTISSEPTPAPTPSTGRSSTESSLPTTPLPEAPRPGTAAPKKPEDRGHESFNSGLADPRDSAHRVQVDVAREEAKAREMARSTSTPSSPTPPIGQAANTADKAFTTALLGESPDSPTPSASSGGKVKGSIAPPGGGITATGEVIRTANAEAGLAFQRDSK